MALVSVNGTFPMTTNDTFVLGDGSTNEVAVWELDIVPTGAATGTITIVGRAANIGGVSVTTPGFVAIPYQSLHLNGAAGTGAFVTTAITSRSLILVPASGISVGVTMASISGAWTVYARPLNGPNN